MCVRLDCEVRLQGRLSVSHPEDERFQKTHVHTINPLALSNDEMYGAFDAATHEWQDGILARIMRTVCKVGPFAVILRATT